MSLEYGRKIPKSLVGLTAALALGSVAGCGAVKFTPNANYPTSWTLELGKPPVPPRPTSPVEKALPELQPDRMGGLMMRVSQEVLRSCGVMASNGQNRTSDSICFDANGPIKPSTFDPITELPGNTVTNPSLDRRSLTVVLGPNGQASSVKVQTPDIYEQSKAGEITTATIERMDSSGQKSINPEYEVCLNKSNLQADYVTWKEKSTCANSSENPEFSKKVLDLFSTTWTDKGAHNDF